MPQSSNSNNKPPLNEQIADIVLKVVMTGDLAGGGFGAFWSLFKDSNIPKAIAAAAIGLGISYAAKMLQPIHKGTQRRLEQFGKPLMMELIGSQIAPFPNVRQLAILAWGGYGKTTLLKHIAYRYGTKQAPDAGPYRVPVLLVLRNYLALLAQESPPDLPELMTKHHIPDLPSAANLQPLSV